METQQNIYMCIYMCVCVYGCIYIYVRVYACTYKKLGLPGYIDSMRIVGMHAAIFNIITLMATVSMMGYQKS